jgi:hypothetical protein
MCDRCDELDEKIENYRKLASWVSDELALEGISTLIRQFEAEKRILHPEQQ